MRGLFPVAPTVKPLPGRIAAPASSPGRMDDSQAWNTVTLALHRFTRLGLAAPGRHAEARRVSAARPVYGVADVSAESERSRLDSGVLPLLALVLGLAAATIWFVALPALDGPPPRAERACEVVVLEPGSTKCVPKRTADSPLGARKAVRSGPES